MIEAKLDRIDASKRCGLADRELARERTRTARLQRRLRRWARGRVCASPGQVLRITH